MTPALLTRQSRAAALIALGGALFSAGCTSAKEAGPVLPVVQQVPARACAQAIVPAADAQMILPFEIVGGRVYVQARVNDTGPYTFAIDTGASGLARADASLTKALGLKVVGSADNGDGVTVASADTVHFDALDLGGLVQTDFDVITRDYSANLAPEAAISGIIGREFFADGLLVIDFPARTLSFSQTRALTPDAEGALPFERAFRVPVMIGERTYEANLDTGAGVTMVFPRALYDEVSNDPLEAAGQGSLSNTKIGLDRGRVHGPVRIGDADVSDIEVRVSGEFPELLVGGEVLQDYRIAFDQRSRLVAVCPPVP